jgi:hypothetical protein
MLKMEFFIYFNQFHESIAFLVKTLSPRLAEDYENETGETVEEFFKKRKHEFYKRKK